MSFVDFAAIKDRVTIEDGARRLGLDLSSSGEQLRGPCPACQSGGKRALVITPSKHAFYCFGGHVGGDVIALVAHIKQIGMKDAASFLAGEDTPHHSQNSSPEERAGGEGSAKSTIHPLAYLEVEHHLVQALGLEPAICSTFGAGYAPKGIMRGRLAIPIHDGQSGELVAYAGFGLKDEKQPWIFPKGFDPAEHLFFRADMDSDELRLMRDPIEVMMAAQCGLESGIAFLSAPPSADQLDLLARFMRQRGIDHIDLG